MDSTSYFQKFHYYKPKGKGISVYNSSRNDFVGFQNKAKEAQLHTQSLILSESQIDILQSNAQLLIILQDIDIKLLMSKISSLINRLVFPAFYRNIPIAFFSIRDKSHYNLTINSSQIHHDFESVVNYLYIEQLESLLALINFQYPSPSFNFPNLENVHYTPIERILRDKLIDENISFIPQVKFGRFYVDFVIQNSGRKIIVECDGRDFHNPNRDFERDKEISQAGLPIIRLSGSEIYRNVSCCIDKIRGALKWSQCVRQYFRELKDIIVVIDYTCTHVHV